MIFRRRVSGWWITRFSTLSSFGGSSTDSPTVSTDVFPVAKTRAVLAGFRIPRCSVPEARPRIGFRFQVDKSEGILFENKGPNERRRAGAKITENRISQSVMLVLRLPRSS